MNMPLAPNFPMSYGDFLHLFGLLLAVDSLPSTFRRFMDRKGFLGGSPNPPLLDSKSWVLQKNPVFSAIFEGFAVFFIHLTVYLVSGYRVGEWMDGIG